MFSFIGARPLKMNENICNFYFEDSATNRKNLFGEALSSAKHGKVLYILCEELNELPELSQELSSVNVNYMKMISFMYVQSLESLIECISTLPTWQNVPSSIILDDLSRFCDQSNIQNACGVVALLIDTIKSCSILLGKQCKLNISVCKDTVGENYCHTLKKLYDK